MRGPLPRTTLALHKLTYGFTFGATNFAPRRLARLLDQLLAAGYALTDDPVASADYIDLSFDDAYQHMRDHLPPLIDQFGFQPIVFVPTAYIGKTNSWDYSHAVRRDPHLDATGIRELNDLGVVFGSHGHSHCDLTALSPGDLNDELVRSRDILQEITGERVGALSYPFGRHNETVRTAAYAAGYENAYTMTFPELDDRAMEVGRVPIYSYDTWFTIRQKIEGGVTYRLERAKAGFTNWLSGGTVLLNRLRGHRAPGDS